MESVTIEVFQVKLDPINQKPFILKTFYRYYGPNSEIFFATFFDKNIIPYSIKPTFSIFLTENLKTGT
jgi:hypothetical protein